MFVFNADVAASLKPFCSADALPMNVKVKSLTQDHHLSLYSNLSVEDFIKQVAGLLGMQENKIKVTMVDETKIVRVDT